MYCKNCGKKIPDDSKYCPICGANIADLPYSDTPARNDTELHVEYLRMTPTNPEIMNKQVSKNNKTLIALVKAINIIGPILIILMMGTIGIVNIVAASQADSRLQLFGLIWLICVTVITLAFASLNLAIGILDKNAGLTIGKAKAKENMRSKITFFVIAIICAGFLIFYAYLLLKNPSFLSLEKNIWIRIVTTILIFTTIIVLAFSLSTNNHIVDTSKKNSIKK